MLVCKLDASGTDDGNAIITMAGYVALLPAWFGFEVDARKLFGEYGVEVLHAKEFYDTKGAFNGWSRDKKHAVVRELQRRIVGRLDLGITFSSLKSEFSKAKREHKVAHNESVFGFCFRAIIAGLLADAILKEAIAHGEDLTLVLESGDENGRDAERIFKEVKALSSWHGNALRSFGFADRKARSVCRSRIFSRSHHANTLRSSATRTDTPRNRPSFRSCATGFT